jgi:uncharacterized protein (DUF302 family)
MHFFSKYLSPGFADAVAAAKAALEEQRFSILAEIDVRQALRTSLGVDSRPYLILSACSLPLVQRAIRVDDAISSILLCNVAVREQSDGRIEVSVADPSCTIGTINHVEMITIAQELQSMVRTLINDIEPPPRIHRAA